jgi:hypothetical protein
MNKKSTVTHTPGPWEVIDNNRKGDLYIGAKNDVNAFAIANIILPLIDSATVRANASLIAAAPDLLAACQAALEEIQHFSFGTVKQISDAISKATDETDD